MCWVSEVFMHALWCVHVSLSMVHGYSARWLRTSKGPRGHEAMRPLHELYGEKLRATRARITHADTIRVCCRTPSLLPYAL